jgi:hypothetical protein
VLGLSTLATTTPAANVATFLTTPSSANLSAALTDKTGTGANVFATSPTITTPTIAQINGGTAANDDIRIQGTTDSTRASSFVFLQPNGGNVGIGTNATPQSLLDVRNSAATVNRIIIGTNAGGFNNGGEIAFYSAGGGATGLVQGTFDNSSVGRLTFANLIGGAMTVVGTFLGNSLGIGTTSPSTKALLDLTSTTQGFLPPRMTTTQRDAITSVPAGLMIYNTTTNKLNFYNGSAWEAVTSA